VTEPLPSQAPAPPSAKRTGPGSGKRARLRPALRAFGSRLLHGVRALGPRLLREIRYFPHRTREALYRNRVSLTLLALSVSGAVAIFVVMGLVGIFDLPFIIKNIPSGLGPAELALEFTTFTFLVGMVGAIGLGMVRAHPPKKTTRRGLLWRWPLYGFASGYVAAIRGTPFLVQLQIVYFAVIFTSPRLTFLGWDANYLAGFAALLLNTTGYQAEAFRGGFQSVDAGQTEAGRAVGLSRLQVFGRITLPQSLRLVTLPLANEWISNFKTATILSYIGVIEIFFWARNDIAALTGRDLEAFVLLTLFYLIINVTVSRVITYVEKVRRIPGLGTPIPEIGISTRILGAGGAGRSSSR